MLTVKWSVKALAERIWQAVARLAEMPQMGRPGVEPGTRHWSVQRTPYLIVYRENAGALEILRVWHGRQDWLGED